MPENNLPFQKGKKKRETLRLPTLHFIAADDWMHKLTYEGFAAWLQFHTWVDRTDANREYDKIPMSLEAAWEKLNVSKSKFYRLIKPMWEFGLIDIVEYEESTRTGQKPKNIIVYEYPFHDEARMFLPLEKIRDWGKDYDSVSKIAGETGGRPRKKLKGDQVEEVAQLEPLNEPDQEKEPEKPGTDHRFKIETVDRFKIKTVTVSKLKPNNVLNNSINYQITTNNFTKENLSIRKEIAQLNIPTVIVEMLKTQIDRLILLKIKLIEIEMVFHDYKTKMGHDEFKSVLYDCLQAKSIDFTFKGYLSKSLDTMLTNKAKKDDESNQGIVRDESSYETDYSHYNFKAVEKSPDDQAYERLQDIYEKDIFKYGADFIEWIEKKEIELNLPKNSTYNVIYKSYVEKKVEKLKA